VKLPELDGVEVTMIVVELLEADLLVIVFEEVIVGCEVIDEEMLEARLEELDRMELEDDCVGWLPPALWLSEDAREVRDELWLLTLLGSSF
jgi:hypothetical protein